MRTSSSLLAVGHILSTHLATKAYAETTNLTLEPILNNLELYWSYGRSPPFYPTPQAMGTGDWADAYSKANALVAQMTNEEKEFAVIGYASTTNGCSGNSGNVSRLNFPGLCLNDAGDGLRGTDGVSGYPSAIHAGASWNRNLVLNRAQYMGQEFKAKGVNVILGPVVGPLGRIAENGRNFEGFANDPYLSGKLTAQTITGLQESVIACTKHFIAYEQESNRIPPILGPDAGLNSSVSSNLDDKTMHETYLWPFADAVHAGTGSVMCSYNRVNDSYACQNSYTQNNLLKTELGFQGFIVSDWTAQHTGVASANSGLDMAMPDSVYWSGNLTLAVTNGSMTQTRLDDMVTRIVAAWYKYAPVAHPGNGMPVDLSLPHEFVNARNPASKSTIFQGAVEGHVLVKNVNNTLPLCAPPMLSLFGYDAVAPALLDYGESWDLGWTPEGVYDLETLIIYLENTNTNYNTPGAAYNGTMAGGGGSGAITPPFISAPFDAISNQAYEDGTDLMWDFINQDPVVSGASSACLVFINEFASEGFDRPSLADPWSDQLVINVANQCNNTIVSIHNAGVRTVDAWIDHPNITAVIYSHLPGQDSGRALVELLYGRQSFSGRLPYTVGAKQSDYGSLLSPTLASATSDWYTQANFTEGVYIDYKSFIARNVTPQFAFGYGLTYSNFSYSSLITNVLAGVSLSELPPNGTVMQGGLPSLWENVAVASVVVENTGNVAAAEVAQLYLGIPGGPEKQLRGFGKELLEPGQRCTIEFPLMRRDLSVWDTVQQQWIMQSGEYLIYVGKSVLDIQLTGSITIQT